MTYDEALELKQKFGSNYQIEKNIDGLVMILPNNINDLELYIAEFRFGKFDDNSAKLYSSDSHYQVCALWTDGVNVIKKKLT